MNVTLSADSDGVSKVAGYRFHCSDDVLPALADRRAWLHFTKSIHRKNGPIPCTEVFRCEIMAADFPYVRIDIDRTDRVGFPVLHVLK